MNDLKEFNPESLAPFDGKNGNPIYVSYQGRVIDLSQSKLWKSGLHMKRHSAGKDLTAEISAAPHGPEVLERYPQVGILKKKEEGESGIPAYLSGLLERYPFLRRHVHPMMVHFPIGFMIAPVLFILLYFITGLESFEITAWFCLGAGIIFSPLAIGSGYFTWWLNYGARRMRPVTIKIRCSFLLLAVSLFAFFWRYYHPKVFADGGGGALYFLLLLGLIPIVSVIGWYGATLTFPLEKRLKVPRAQDKLGKPYSTPPKG